MSFEEFLTQTVAIGFMDPRTGEGVKTWPETDYSARLDTKISKSKMADPLFGGPDANLFLSGDPENQIRADDVVYYGDDQFVVLAAKEMRDKMRRRHYEVSLALQKFQLASVLRYTEVGGKAHLGIPPTKTLIAGLNNQNCYVQRVSTREVAASAGILELTDLRFVFYFKVLETDKILYEEKNFDVIQVQFYDKSNGKCAVVGRAV